MTAGELAGKEGIMSAQKKGHGQSGGWDGQRHLMIHAST